MLPLLRLITRSAKRLVLPLALCMAFHLAGAQTATSSPLISLVQPPQAAIAGGSTPSSMLTTTTVFPRTVTGTNGSTQTIQFRVNRSLSITNLSFAKSVGGKEEFKVLGTSGCNTDGSYSNIAGTVCSVTVQFTPAYPGVRTVPLKITTNEGVVSLGVTGTGVAPLAVLTPGIISTFAGNGTNVDSGDGGPVGSASFFNPSAIAIDSSGNLYVSTGNSYIRKIDATTGLVSTIAGNGTYDNTGDGGPATSASIAVPTSMVFGPDGALYFNSSTATDSAIRKVDMNTGIISKVAGNGTTTVSGDGGPAIDAGMQSLAGIAIDLSGNIYLADLGSYSVRKIDAASGIITTVAGNGTMGSSGDGGQATDAAAWPYSIAVDSAGNFYITSLSDAAVRKVDVATGIISTVAGGPYGGYSGDGGPATSAQIQYICPIAIDAAGQIYIVDSIDNVVRKVDTRGIITTIAGNAASGFSGDGGVATAASFKYPYEVTLDGAGNLYILDMNNYRIRRISSSASATNFPTETVAGTADSADGPRSVTLTNIGNMPLTLAALTTSSNPFLSTQDFTYSSSSTCPQIAAGGASASLAAGTSCTLAAEFTPTLAGNLTTNLVVTNDSGNLTGSQQTIALTGRASSSTADITSVTVGSLGTTRYLIGTTVNLTAAVADVTTPASTPSGTVVFRIYNGSNLLSTSAAVPVSGGAATYPFTTANTGTLTVQASYTTADPNLYRSSADMTGQPFVVVGDFSIYIPNGGNNVGLGITGGLTAPKGSMPAKLDVLVTPGQGGFPTDVTMSVSGLPPGAVASISPSTIAQNGGSTTATVTIDLSHVSVNAQQGVPLPFPKAPVVFAGIFFLGGFCWRKRRLGVPLLLAGLFAIVSTMTGCLQSTSANLSSYDLIVKATSGGVERSTNIKFSITK